MRIPMSRTVRRDREGHHRWDPKRKPHRYHYEASWSHWEDIGLFRRAHRLLYSLSAFAFSLSGEESRWVLWTDRGNRSKVNHYFQTVFRTFLRHKQYIQNALETDYSNAKLEATNKLIKDIKRLGFGFRNFINFKKRVFITLNIKKEKTYLVLSRC